MNDSINNLRDDGGDEYRDDQPKPFGTGVEPDPQPLWSMTFRIMPDGTRDLDVTGEPSIATMMSEFNTLIENLRAQLFVDKLMMQGKNDRSRIIRPGQ